MLLNVFSTISLALISVGAGINFAWIYVDLLFMFLSYVCVSRFA
jgi:hypothetical protein